MGQVSVPVNGRSFTISCDDGQEPRIRRLAQYVDAKVSEFVGSVGQVGEGRLLLLAALTIADELSDANEALQRERSRAAVIVPESNGSAAPPANGVHRLANQAEAIAASPQTP